MVISPSGGGTRSHKITPYIGVNLEMLVNHSVTGGMMEHLLNLYQCVEEARDKMDNEMVG